jgi:AP-1 complex subunit mu
MNVKLSGMPEVRIGLNDRLQFEATGRPVRGKTVELEDIKFHGCVRLNKFEVDRTISFCPPEGELELMTYRLQTTVRPLIQVETNVIRHGSSRVEVQLRAKSTYKKTAVAPIVEVFIPVPSDADSPSAKATRGTVKHQPEKDALVWSIPNFPGGAEFRCACTYHLPSVRTSDQQALAKQPVRVKFEVPYFTVSGFQVRYLKVTEPKLQYETFPWVRYISRSGDYQIRTA